MAAWALCSLPTSKTAIFSTSMLNTTMIVISVFESSLSSHRPLFLGSHRLVKLDGRRVDGRPTLLPSSISKSTFHTMKGGWSSNYTTLSSSLSVPVHFTQQRVDGCQTKLSPQYNVHVYIVQEEEWMGPLTKPEWLDS